MKLIIDIPNGLYPNLGKIQNGSIATKRILDCVRNGTPLLESEDYVSRQAAIDALTKTSGIRGDALKALYDLPPVTPAENMGTWIKYVNNWVECSRCHELSCRKTNFCPNCGAKMQEVKDA